MSTFETKIADNFIYDTTLHEADQDSLKTPFLKKSVSYVVDQQAGNGSYTSGEVIIDTSSIAANGSLNDWRNAYVAVPLNTGYTVQWGTSPGSITGGTGVGKLALGMKNPCLLDSLKVEANGKTILTATQGLSQLVNFKLMATQTTSSLAKDGAVIGFYPDDFGSIANGTADSINSANDPVATAITGDALIQCNRGFVERQNNWLPQFNAAFMTDAYIKEEGGAYDAVNSGAGGSIPTAGNTLTSVSDVHWVGVIRLKDIADYFDKHSLSRGVSYRFTFRFNQAVSTITTTSSTTPFSVNPASISTVQTSGSAQPAMLAWGDASILGRLTLGASTVGTIVVSHAIDTTANARFSGVRMYVPSYELDPSHQEELIGRNPIVKRDFLDFMTQTTQTYAASGASINVQVSTSATNPRALIVIPRWSQTATGNGGQGFYSDASPLSTVPGSTDALLSLTNCQVRLGSNYVLPDRLYYTFQQFQDHLSGIFAINGDQSVLTGGLISKKSFEVNQRYYAFDLSRYPEAMNNLPQMVSFECKNNTVVAIELTCILLYGRSVEQNLANGSMTCTA